MAWWFWTQEIHTPKSLPPSMVQWKMVTLKSFLNKGVILHLHWKLGDQWLWLLKKCLQKDIRIIRPCPFPRPCKSPQMMIISALLKQAFYNRSSHQAWTEFCRSATCRDLCRHFSKASVPTVVHHPLIASEIRDGWNQLNDTISR